MTGPPPRQALACGNFNFPDVRHARRKRETKPMRKV